MDCAQYRAIVDGDMKRCRACINVRALSISDVDEQYKGWLACDIIASRSHGGADEHTTDCSGNTTDAGHACGAMAGAEREGVEHEEA